MLIRDGFVGTHDKKIWRWGVRNERKPISDFTCTVTPEEGCVNHNFRYRDSSLEMVFK